MLIQQPFVRNLILVLHLSQIYDLTFSSPINERSKNMKYLYFILAVIAGPFFYWMRERHKIGYGTIEILVGVSILAARFILPQPSFFLLNSSGNTAYFYLLT